MPTQKEKQIASRQPQPQATTGYRCEVAPFADPIVDIQTGEERGGRFVLFDKPKVKYRRVRQGRVVAWVDPCSRKHFTILDAETQRLNDEDYKRLNQELEQLLLDGSDDPKNFEADIPDDAKIWEIAEQINKIKAVTIGEQAKTKKRSFGLKEKVKARTKREEIIFQLTALGVDFKGNMSNADLEGLLAKELEKRDNPDDTGDSDSSNE